MFLTFPFVLAWKSIRHYLLPTIYVFVARFVGFFVSRALCLACKACGCYEFVDKDFPEEKAMRGLATSKVKCARVSSSTLEDCQWKRASELKPPVGMKRMQLFNGIEPQTSPRASSVTAGSWPPSPPSPSTRARFEGSS